MATEPILRSRCLFFLFLFLMNIKDVFSALTDKYVTYRPATFLAKSSQYLSYFVIYLHHHQSIEESYRLRKWCALVIGRNLDFGRKLCAYNNDPSADP